MIERRIIRALVVPNKIFYFNDRGTQRDVTYGAFQSMERELNAQVSIIWFAGSELDDQGRPDDSVEPVFARVRRAQHELGTT